MGGMGGFEWWGLTGVVLRRVQDEGELLMQAVWWPGSVGCAVVALCVQLSQRCSRRVSFSPPDFACSMVWLWLSISSLILAPI